MHIPRLTRPPRLREGETPGWASVLDVASVTDLAQPFNFVGDALRDVR